ncbi:hypothetical protein Droror1_Dr00024456 [Drosera rotundifolia]
MCLADLKSGRPYSCKALVKPCPAEDNAQKEQKPRAFSFDVSRVNEDAIDSGCLTFDSGKMKVDKDPFPKAAKVNLMVITLLNESVRDKPRPEGQKLTKEEMWSVQRQDKKRHRVFARISEPTENLCVCCQRDISLVRRTNISAKGWPRWRMGHVHAQEKEISPLRAVNPHTIAACTKEIWPANAGCPKT